VKVAECVVNVSEGRNLNIIKKLENSISINGSIVLHTDSNFSANRTVITFYGKLDDLYNSVVSLYEEALVSIDMRNHHGCHPRIGSVDVCPFVPLGTTTIHECVALAEKCGAIIADKFNIPVFFYGTGRKELAELRRGGFESLAERFKLNELNPDCGSKVSHPTFGATIIGARKILIAYNISLKSRDVVIAKKIARKFRVNYPLAPVRTLGWFIPEYDCVQVSTNILDYRKYSIYQVYNQIQELAKNYNIPILGSEIIGLCPENALITEDIKTVESAIIKLGLSFHKNFNSEKRILDRIINIKLENQ
jgi:glutamate formiminotransferase / 5-formyltetrahydrofolate cyclo-ligase